MTHPGYILDIQELLVAYAQTQAMDFSSFKSLWGARNFSFIHQGQPKAMKQSSYIQLLYSAILSYMDDTQALNARVGALYALYTLYETQNAEPKTLVYLSTVEVAHMRSLLKEIKEHQLADALLVMRAFYSLRLFLCGAVACSAMDAVNRVARLADLSTKKIKRTRETLLGPQTVRAHFEKPLIQEKDLKEFEKWAEEYSRAKSIAFNEHVEEVGEGEDQDRSGKKNGNGHKSTGIVEKIESWEAYRRESLEKLMTNVPLSIKQKAVKSAISSLESIQPESLSPGSSDHLQEASRVTPQENMQLEKLNEINEKHVPSTAANSSPDVLDDMDTGAEDMPKL